jgi:hypothetical protein
VELKIAGRWTAKQLRERLENQLVGQYMREARHGTFLLVNRGGRKDRKRWGIDGKMQDFARLTNWLAGEAESLLKERDIEGLRVIGIDLLVRDQDARTPSKRTKVKRRRAKKAPKAKRPKSASSKSRRRRKR